MQYYKELNIIEKKVSYNIKEKNGVIITTCIVIAVADIYNNFIATREKITITGQAFCDPKDTYDETIGSKIAYNRAMINLNGKLKQILHSRYIDTYNKNNNDYKEQMNKLENRSNHNRENLHHIIKNLPI